MLKSQNRRLENGSKNRETSLNLKSTGVKRT